MLKVLDVEGAVAREGTKWVRVPGGLALRRRALRARDRAAPPRAGGDGGLRRRRPLPDARAARGARRPRPAGLRRLRGLHRAALRRPAAPALVREAALHLRSRPLVLDVKKMAPDAEGKMRKLADDVRAEEGRALARLGDGGWDPLIQDGRRNGPLRRRARGGRRRGRAQLACAGRAGSRPCRPSAAASSSRTSRSGWRHARPAVPARCSSASATTRPARDDQLRPAGGERPRRVRRHRRAAGRGVPARRRRPLQRLDAGDGRGPAAPQGRGAVYPFALSTAF